MRSVLAAKLTRSGSATVALIVTSLAAPAADMPTKVQPFSAAPYYTNWGGFYAGVSGGWATGSSKHVSGPTDGGADISNSFHMRGALIGGTLGYNWNIGNWVAGVEGDWSWTNKKGNGNDIPPFPPTFVSSTKENWLATLRARAGYALSNDWLLYATGGLAIADIKVTVDGPGVSASEAKTRLGWTLGGGVEKQIWGNWSAKAEYLHVKISNSGYLANPPTPIVVRGNVPVTDNIFRVGLNYRFGAPLPSRY